MYAFEWAPICFLVHELSACHIAFGPAAVLAAEYLVAFLDGSDASGSFGRILRHNDILSHLRVRAIRVMHKWDS